MVNLVNHYPNEQPFGGNPTVPGLDQRLFVERQRLGVTVVPSRQIRICAAYEELPTFRFRFATVAVARSFCDKPILVANV